MVKDIFKRYGTAFADSSFRRLLTFSALFFAASLVFIFYAIGYASTRASNHVTDIILSNIPVFEVGWYFVYGTFSFVFIAMAVTVWRPTRLPLVLSALALFFFIRGVFISITHLAPFPVEFTLDIATIFTRIFNGGDQFFSGHTGAPFLLALLYWQYLPLRLIFLGWSIFFAIIVLLGHLHYSIDVLAAFFITYTIYRMALYLFPRARAFFYVQE